MFTYSNKTQKVLEENYIKLKLRGIALTQQTKNDSHAETSPKVNIKFDNKWTLK